jgi:hypothetical protein
VQAMEEPHGRAAAPAPAPGGPARGHDAVPFLVRGRRGQRLGWHQHRSTASVHALDMAIQRRRRVRAAALRGRSLFSVTGMGDKLYVGGRSRGSAARSVKAKTHKGSRCTARSPGRGGGGRPRRCGRISMSGSRSVVHTRADKHLRRAHAGSRKFWLEGTSAVYEDPHRLSLRRLRLRDLAGPGVCHRDRV